MTRVRALAVALAVAVLVPAGCSDDGPGEGEARLEVDGRAVVERADGERDDVTGSTDLGPGDRVELAEGQGLLLFGGGTRMELRAGLEDAANSVLRMGTTPELEAGDVLVSTEREAALEAAGSTLRVVEGSARVSRALGVGVAAYDADVELDSAGQVREIPALREMHVPVLGRPPQAPRPLSYQPADPWDRRFLGQAMELGERLEALANGYTQNLDEGEGRTPGFFRIVLPGLEEEPQFTAELIDLDRPPGETLVGAAIADLGQRGDFVERWRAVFGFRDEGAAWGLVTLDQDVDGDPLLGTIEQAVAASPLAFADALAPVTTPGRTPPATTTTAPDGPAAGSGPGTPTTAPPPTTTAPPPPTTTPGAPPAGDPLPPLQPTLEPLLEPVTDLISGLVGGLLGALGGGSGG